MNDLTYRHTKAMEIQKPFFSIVIPVYNAAAYLRDCLDSILAQEFEDWEAVLVDDCSTDASVAIGKEYQNRDSRIRLFTSERNSGGAYAPRLMAALLAEADYIVTIDADDEVSPDLLKQLHAKISTTGADLVIPELWRIEKKGLRRILPAKEINIDRIWTGKELVGHTLVNWEIPMCGFAARRDLYLKADRNVSTEDKKSLFSDELHSRWLLSLCKSIAICQAKYYYRENEESVTNVNLPRVIESRLHTCDGLIAMASECFGEDSPTHIRALEDKLYSAVGMMRLISDSKLNASQRHLAEKSISVSMQAFELSKLKGKTSPRYLTLMHLPIPLARMALKILDPIIRK